MTRNVVLSMRVVADHCSIEDRRNIARDISSRRLECQETSSSIVSTPSKRSLSSIPRKHPTFGSFDIEVRP